MARTACTWHDHASSPISSLSDPRLESLRKYEASITAHPPPVGTLHVHEGSSASLSWKLTHFAFAPDWEHHTQPNSESARARRLKLLHMQYWTRYRRRRRQPAVKDERCQCYVKITSTRLAHM